MPTSTPSNWVMTLDIDFNETKGNFTGYSWYKDNVSQGASPPRCKVNDTVNFAVKAANVPQGGVLARLILTVGKLQGAHDGTRGSPFNIGNSAAGSAQCYIEQTSSFGAPISGYEGFTSALPVQQDTGAAGKRSKYEFTLVAVYTDGTTTRQFGCDPEMDVDNDAP